MSDDAPRNKIRKLATHTDAVPSNSSVPTTLIEIDEQENKNVIPDIKKAGFNRNYVVDFSTDNISVLQNISKKYCKVLILSSNLSLEQVLEILSKLNSEKLPYLFIFIIDVVNSVLMKQVSQECFKLFEQHLVNFSKDRPLLLQVRSISDNATSLFYKDHHSKIFSSIDNRKISSNQYRNIASFLFYILKKKVENFDQSTIEKVIKAENSCIIIRFIKTLQLQENFRKKLILNITLKGNVEQFLAAVDFPFDIKNGMLNFEVKSNLSRMITIERSINLVEPCTSQSSSNINSASNTYPTSVITSVFYTSLNHSRAEIMKFLIKNFMYLIQMLPYNHQIQISTLAFSKKQYDILCELLQLLEFPFPKNFNPESFTHGGLKLITMKWKKFHEAIEVNGIDTIKMFINDNSNLRIVYSFENETALSKALRSNNIELIVLLKSFGFEAEEYSSYYDQLDIEAKHIFNAYAEKQFYENLNNSHSNDAMSVLLLSSKSLIHNIGKIDMPTKQKYQKLILKWFSQIYKIEFGKELLDVAAQCELLKIVFDFDSKMVVNLDLKSTVSLGATIAEKKCILIGAKLTSDNHIDRELEIKGVLAHELCHYVLFLVFENLTYPYYKYDIATQMEFDQISNDINKWTYHDHEGNKFRTNNNLVDDCDGMISGVYTEYNREDYHLELIVKVLQILTQFDGCSEKIQILKRRYHSLFDFYKFKVAPQMQKFILKNRNCNKLFGLMPEIEELSLNFSTTNLLPSLSPAEVVIAICNVPFLLFHEIYYQACSQQNHRPFIDEKIVFIESKIMNNKVLTNIYQNMQSESNDLITYINCSREIGTNIEKFFVKNTEKLFFVVKSEVQYDELSEIINNINGNTQKIDISYEFTNISLEDRKKFLHIKIHFQNFEDSLLNLMMNEEIDEDEIDEKQKDIAVNDLTDIVNIPMLNNLLENEKISINSKLFDEIDNEINYNVLFHPRKYIKDADNVINIKTEISLEQLVEDTRMEKYVIISDIAGTGKTWAMKSITKLLQQKFKRCWVSYVDLKQFTKAFILLKKQPEITTFMTKYVLQAHQNVESNFFKKLYEKGRTFLLFDGFDEISPNYYDTAIKIILSFQSNGNNQLWIATRDHLEVSLKENLKINVTYKLDEFSNEDGIDLISKTWTLNDYNGNPGNECFKNISEIEISPTLKNHQRVARRLVIKISSLKFSSIGFPQFYKMIAEVFKNENTATNENSIYKIYFEFVKIHLRRMSEKGELRTNQIENSQLGIPDFSEMHQYLAMNNIFPDENIIYRFEVDELDWPDEEIIGCGLIVKIVNSRKNVLFLHETFCEYFVADYILYDFKNGGNSNLMRVFIKILSNSKYDVIRMFINDALADEMISKKINFKMQKLGEIFNKSLIGSENFSASFKGNQSNLILHLIQLLRMCQYSKLKDILDINIEAIILNNEFIMVENVLKFHEFFIEALEVDDLKQMIFGREILYKYLQVSRDPTILNNFMNRVEHKLGKHFVTELLCSKNSNGQNIFVFMNIQNHFNHLIFEYFIGEICPKYISIDGLLDMIEHCDNYGQNALYKCVLYGEDKPLELVWKKFEELFSTKSLSQKFRNLLKKKYPPNQYNFLSRAIKCNNINFHKKFWELIVKTFQNREELKEFILQKGDYQENFVHQLIRYSSTEIIHHTLETIESFFDEDQFHEIINSEGYKERNLFQSVAAYSKDVNVYKKIWQILWKSCKESKEIFVKIISKPDEGKYNIFHWTVAYSIFDPLEFLFEETEKIASPDDIRNILSSLSITCRNILYVASNSCNSKNIHQLIWNVLNNYFEPSDLLAFVSLKTTDNRNVIDVAVDKNTQEIVALTWRNIKDLLEKTDIADNVLNEAIILCDNIINNIETFEIFDEISKKTLKTKWNEVADFINNNIKTSVFQVSVPQNEDKLNSKNLIDLACYKDVKLYKNAWEVWFKAIEDLEYLKKLLFENDFVHRLVSYSSPDIVAITFELFRTHFSDAQFKEIVESKGLYGRNIIHTVIAKRRTVAEFKKVWNIMRLYYKTEMKLVELYGEVDDLKLNYFHTSVRTSKFQDKEIFEYLINELELVEEKSVIKKLLSSINIHNKNLLQVAVERSNNTEVHISLWKIMRQYFDSAEIFDFAYHLNSDGQHLIFTAIKYCATDNLKLIWNELEKSNVNMIKLTEHKDNNSKNILNICIESKNEDILEFIWKQLEKLYDTQNLIALIKHKYQPNENNILHQSVFYMVLKFHEKLWELLLKTIQNSQELIEIIFQRNVNEDNFIHHLVKISNENIIEFVLNEMKKYLTDDEFRKILDAKGFQDQNLLHKALANSKGINVHKYLFKIIKIASKDMFVKMIKHIDFCKKNIFHYIAEYSTREIFEFMMEELRDLISKEDIIQLLIAHDWEGKNLLHYAVKNGSSEIYRIIFNILNKNVDHQEIIDLIKQVGINK